MPLVLITAGCTRIQELSLQIRRFELACDMREISSRGMALVAMARSVEIFFTRRGAARHHILYFIAGAIRRGVDLRVKELGNIVSLRIRQSSERRHTFIRASVVKKRPKHLTFRVVKHQSGTQQIRALSTPRIIAMAEAAVLNEQLLSA